MYEKERRREKDTSPRGEGAILVQTSPQGKWSGGAKVTRVAFAESVTGSPYSPPGENDIRFR